MAVVRNCCWASWLPMLCTMKPPAKAHGTEPATSSAARRRLGEPCRQCTAAPTDLLMLAATRSLATAAVGSIPRTIRAGVISAPPPMPVRPTTMPTPKLTTSTDTAVVVSRSPIAGRRCGRERPRGVEGECRHQVGEALLDRPAGGVDADAGVLRLLVRARDAGEVGDLAGSCLGVEALAVASLALLERGGDVHEDEDPAGVLHHGAHLAPGGVEGGDGRADGDAAVPRDLCRHPADPEDVGL